MQKDTLAEWLGAARRADALRVEVIRLTSRGQTVPRHLLTELAKLEDEVQAMLARDAAVNRPQGCGTKVTRDAIKIEPRARSNGDKAGRPPLNQASKLQLRIDHLSAAILRMTERIGAHLTRAEMCERFRVSGKTLTDRVRRGVALSPCADGKWLLSEVMQWEARQSRQHWTAAAPPNAHPSGAWCRSRM